MSRLLVLGASGRRSIAPLRTRPTWDTARTAGNSDQATVAVEHDDTEQAHLCLGWRSLASDDPDRWAMAVASAGGLARR